MIWPILIALLGLVVLMVGAVAIYYLVSYLVLSGVSVLFPLAGRRPRKKER
jgi:hypothetical protein